MSAPPESLKTHRLLTENLFRQLAIGDREAQILETHISSVILAGDYAYKIKKPLNLGFLDFSTLARRHRFCEEEVRLNGRLAPHIYLDVVAICGSPEHPVLDGEGEAIEYAVRMRRFGRQALLSDNPASLTSELADRIADRLAQFHGGIERAADSQAFGDPDAVLFPMRQNFEQVRRLFDDAAMLAKLDRLESWTLKRYRSLRILLTQRKRDGYVRECHGDLHLGNIALDAGELIIFDGIEFNPALRWIDVMSELAFLLMDLDAAGKPVFGQRILNVYLQLTGDYHGLALLRFYQAYRAMVRCKVAAIQLQQAETDVQRSSLRAACARYLDLALGYTVMTAPALLITHGLSGSGKSTVSAELMTQLAAVRLRSDVERKRLVGLDAEADSGSAPGDGIYTTDFTEKTYERLLQLAQTILEAGFTAIVDATFLEAARRQAFAQLADRLRLGFLILDFQAPEAELRKRVAQRHLQGTGASEADVAILERQLAAYRPLGDKEKKRSLVITPSRPLSLDDLNTRLRQQLCDTG